MGDAATENMTPTGTGGGRGGDAQFDIGKLIERLKAVFLNPKAIWAEIWSEQLTLKELLICYYLPLAGLSAVAQLIGGVVFGVDIPFLGTIRASLLPSLIIAIAQVGLSAVYVVIGGKIISALAPKFGGGEVDDLTGSKLLAFSAMPAMAGGVLGIIPLLGLLSIFFAIYGLYIMYQGFQALPNLEDGKKIGFFFVSLVALIVTFAIISMIVFAILPSQYDYNEVSNSISDGLSNTINSIDQEGAQKFLEKMQKMGEAANNAQ